MRAALLATAVIFGATGAFALELPAPGAADPHIRQVSYNPMNRTQLVGELTRQTTITFAQNEQIIRVVFGQGSDPDDVIWEGPDPKDVSTQSLKNNLPLWPVKTNKTNLQVTTLLQSGDQRVYQFALSAKPALPNGEDDPDVTFGLIFKYPAQISAEAVAAYRARKAREEFAQAKSKLGEGLACSSEKLGWRYIARANRAWRDAGWPKPEVCDDGQWTWFSFIGNVDTPAIYVVDKKECVGGGNERRVDTTSQNNWKTVKQTGQHFRLRIGSEAVMEVCNEDWDGGIGRSPGTGTTSPNVTREVVVSK